MRNTLIVLKLVLDELGIPCNVSTRSGRSMIQNSIYLVQSVARVDLGYTFGDYEGLVPSLAELTEKRRGVAGDGI